MRIILAATCAFIASVGVAYAEQPSSVPVTDKDYMERVMMAAPPQIVAEATIVRQQNGAMRTLKQGANQWTCMEANGVPMCMDPNAMVWAHAWQSHAPPPEKTGFIYMLAGDTGPAIRTPIRWRRRPTTIGYKPART
jgi:hypothetical protein